MQCPLIVPFLRKILFTRGVNRHFFFEVTCLKLHVMSNIFLNQSKARGFWSTANQAPFLQCHIKKEIGRARDKTFFHNVTVQYWIMGIYSELLYLDSRQIPKLTIDNYFNYLACPLRLDVFRLVLEHVDTCINIYSSYHFMSFFQKPISERFSLGGLLSYRPFSYCTLLNRIHKLFLPFFISHNMKKGLCYYLRGHPYTMLAIFWRPPSFI